MADTLTDASGELKELPSELSDTSLPFDRANSNHYNQHGNEYAYGLIFDYSDSNKEFSLQLPLTSMSEHISYQTNLLDTLARRSYTKFEPEVSFATFGSTRFSMSYKLSREDPELYVLMPYTNAVNPLSVRINNSSLKHRTIHRLDMNLSFHPKNLSLSWWLGAEGRIIRHDWGTRTRFNPNDGSFLYERANVRKLNWNTRFTSGMSWNFDAKKRWTLSVDDYVAYVRSVDYDISYGNLSDDLSTVNTTTTGLTTKLNYRLNKLSVGIVGNIDGRFSRSGRSGFSNINTCDFRYGGSAQYTIPVLNVNIGTDLNMYSRRGYESHEMNKDNLIWNGFLSKGFWKSKLIAKVEAFDILHELKNKQYTVNAQGRTESWYQSVPRFVMFSLIFNILQGK